MAGAAISGNSNSEDVAAVTAATSRKSIQQTMKTKKTSAKDQPYVLTHKPLALRITNKHALTHFWLYKQH